MIITDKITYCDSIISYYAYPESNPNCKFRIRCEIPDGIRIDDYYLSTYLETEMEQIVKDKVDQHILLPRYFSRI